MPVAGYFCLVICGDCAECRFQPDKAHVPSKVSFAKYGAPESRFCPAGVYEYPEVGASSCGVGRVCHCTVS